MSRQIIDWDTIVSHCVCVRACVCVYVYYILKYLHPDYINISTSYISKEKVKPILKIVSFLKYP